MRHYSIYVTFHQSQYRLVYCWVHMQLHMVTQTLRMYTTARQAECVWCSTCLTGQSLVFLREKLISEVCSASTDRFVSTSQPELYTDRIDTTVWWTVCMVDVWSSAAVKVPRIMPLDTTVSYPIDEIPFSSMSADFTSNFINNPATYESPILTEMIKLNRILLQVIDFNRRCVSEHLEGEALEIGVRSLSRELGMWLESLPHHMRDTPENFKWFASRGLGRFFAALYLGYYHYGQLLNYQFLGADAISTSTLYAADCKHHASKLCEVVYRSFSTPGSEVMYPAVAHILVIASTVQIHTLLFSGDNGQIRQAKSRLERNFEILLRLRPFWSSVDSAMSRLRAFHQTCLRSKDTSFVLDRWLLRFLVQFAPHMELEPRDNDPHYEALLALSKQSPLSCSSVSVT